MREFISNTIKMEDLKKALQENKVIIGKDRVLKKLRIGKLERVYLASNCPLQMKEDIKHFAKINNIKVVEAKENNEQLGIICKKQFSISVLGY